MESDSHLAIYTIFVLDTTNAVVNIKKSSCVKTNRPGSWFKNYYFINNYIVQSRITKIAMLWNKYKYI